MDGGWMVGGWVDGQVVGNPYCLITVLSLIVTGTLVITDCEVYLMMRWKNAS